MITLAAALLVASAPATRPGFTPELSEYIRARIAEIDGIPDDRRRELDRIAQHVREIRAAGDAARLVFICTHNSRRSHMAQIWAQTAALVYHVAGVETFSGGTEATAFHPNAAAALRRAGFGVEATSKTANPEYAVRITTEAEIVRVFSKKFGDPPNPRSDFVAVMTCSQADRSCPTVPGAALRISLPYEDPKVADGTAGETAAYDERSRQIAREMMYLFHRVTL